MVIGRVDAHLLGPFNGFNEKSDADSSRFVHLSCCCLKMRTEKRYGEEETGVHTVMLSYFQHYI